MDLYKRCHEAIKRYFDKNPEDGEKDFYIVVKEYWGTGHIWNTMYKVKIDWLGRDENNDLYFGCEFDSDYDEGQKVDILRVFPEHELEDILVDYTYKEAAKNE